MILVFVSLATLVAGGFAAARVPQHQDVQPVSPQEWAREVSQSGFGVRGLKYVVPPVDPNAAQPVVTLVTYDLAVVDHQTNLVVRQVQQVSESGTHTAQQAFDQASRQAAGANDKLLKGFANAEGAASSASDGLVSADVVDSAAGEALMGRIARVNPCTSGDAALTGCAPNDALISAIANERPH
ncbi:MAG: hypothetical protein ACYDCK_13740 [Thermoplasmatota archaeon]